MQRIARRRLSVIRGTVILQLIDVVVSDSHGYLKHDPQHSHQKPGSGKLVDEQRADVKVKVGEEKIESGAHEETDLEGNEWRW